MNNRNVVECRADRLSDVVAEAVRGEAAKAIENDRDIPAITISDLRDGRIHPKDIFVAKTAFNDSMSQARVDDVLFTLKGASMRAAVFDVSASGRPVSANLVILRPNTSILPEVLAAYLNSSSAQRAIKERVKGSTVPTISIKDLLDLPITVPPMAEQQVLRDTLLTLQAIREVSREEQEIAEQTIDALVVRSCAGAES